MVTLCLRHFSTADSRNSSAGGPYLVFLVLYPERWHSRRGANTNHHHNHHYLHGEVFCDENKKSTSLDNVNTQQKPDGEVSRGTTSFLRWSLAQLRGGLGKIDLFLAWLIVAALVTMPASRPHRNTVQIEP